jgi:hypothetical protein
VPLSKASPSSLRTEAQASLSPLGCLYRSPAAVAIEVPHGGNEFRGPLQCYRDVTSSSKGSDWRQSTGYTLQSTGYTGGTG